MEKFLKSALYFRDIHAYHFEADHDPDLLRVETAPLKRYYLDQAFHVERGHWPDLDERGLPWRSRQGHFFHEHECISSWALGVWDLYLLSGDEQHLSSFLTACDYHVETVDRSNPDCWLLKVELPGKGHVGISNSMDHGQAVGMLARGYQVTQREEYVDVATRLLDYLELPIDQGGCLDRVSRAGGAPFFEEDTLEPRRHILNGMIAVLFGLHDLHAVAGVEKAGRLFEMGVDSVRRALPLFDSGWWSWYYIGEVEAPYIASAKYHGCHIAMLRGLYRLTGEPALMEYARRFEGYAARPWCRARALAHMVRAKATDQPQKDARRWGGLLAEEESAPAG